MIVIPIKKELYMTSKNKKQKNPIRKALVFLERYSNLVQSICAIVSVFVIGAVSIIVSVNSNRIADRQLQVSIAENKPIISFNLTKGDNGKSTIEIKNEGTAPLSYNVDVVTFFNFQNSENYLGEIITKIYTWGDSYELKTVNSGDGKLAEITVMDFYNKYVQDINNGIQKLVKQYTDGVWQTEFVYIIRVECVDIFDQHNYTYIMYDGFECNILTEEFGKQLVDEWEYVTDGLHVDQFKDEPMHYVVKYSAATPQNLLGNAVAYLRAKELYAKEADGKIVYYGKFEPENYSEDLE